LRPARSRRPPQVRTGRESWRGRGILIRAIIIDPALCGNDVRFRTRSHYATLERAGAGTVVDTIGDTRVGRLRHNTATGLPGRATPTALRARTRVSLSTEPEHDWDTMPGSNREVSIEDEIAHLRMNRPHVVLMGAGASVAACPSGDKFGRRLPVMRNLAKMLSLDDLIPARRRSNFEAAYSALAGNPRKLATARIIERRIYDYIDGLVLPDEPTIYDYLVLSLRPKDVIATFNWDPFLLQAIRRNRGVLRAAGCPTVLFLHGNVLEGHCHRDKVFGVKDAACSQCHQPFVPSRLLYPVTKKDYASDGFLKDSWTRLSDAFKAAFMVTIFVTVRRSPMVMRSSC